MEWDAEEDDTIELPVFPCENCGGEYPMHTDSRDALVKGEHPVRCAHCKSIQGTLPADDYVLEGIILPPDVDIDDVELESIDDEEEEG